jgi:hypothetical protein
MSLQDREVARGTRVQRVVAPLAAGAGLPNILRRRDRAVSRNVQRALKYGDRPTPDPRA